MLIKCGACLFQDDCITFNTDRMRVGRWSSESCASKRGYICKASKGKRKTTHIADKQIERQTDKETDTERERQKQRQTDRDIDATISAMSDWSSL